MKKKLKKNGTKILAITIIAIMLITTVGSSIMMMI